MKMIACFFGLSFMGWISLIYGLISSRRFRHRQETETTPAWAEFIAYKTGIRKSGYYSTRKVYFPTLRFMAGARQYQATTRYYHEEEKLAPGDAVPILYDPANPSHFHLEEETNEIGEGMARVGWYLIAAGAVISVICQIFVFS